MDDLLWKILNSDFWWLMRFLMGFLEMGLSDILRQIPYFGTDKTIGCSFSECDFFCSFWNLGFKLKNPSKWSATQSMYCSIPVYPWVIKGYIQSLYDKFSASKYLWIILLYHPVPSCHVDSDLETVPNCQKGIQVWAWERPLNLWILIWSAVMNLLQHETQIYTKMT